MSPSADRWMGGGESRAGGGPLGGKEAVMGDERQRWRKKRGSEQQ